MLVQVCDMVGAVSACEAISLPQHRSKRTPAFGPIDESVQLVDGSAVFDCAALLASVLNPDFERRGAYAAWEKLSTRESTRFAALGILGEFRYERSAADCTTSIDAKLRFAYISAPHESAVLTVLARIGAALL
jgi:hypothetical protein